MIPENKDQPLQSGSTAVHEIQQELKHAAQATREQTRRTATLLWDGCAKIASGCKDGVADRVSRLGEALHQASVRLHEKGDARFADGVEGAARKLNGMADYLHKTDVESLRTESKEFTRRHPECVYGGLFLAGVAVARLFRASGPPARSAEAEDFRGDFENE